MWTRFRNDGNMPTQYAASTASDRIVKFCLGVLPTATDFTSTKSLTKGVPGKRSACTSTEESSRPRASASLRVKICVYHSDHYHQRGSELGLNGVDNLYIPTSSLVICFSILSRRTRRTPSTYSAHPSLATWYLRSP